MAERIRGGSGTRAGSIRRLLTKPNWERQAGHFAGVVNGIACYLKGQRLCFARECSNRSGDVVFAPTSLDQPPLWPIEAAHVPFEPPATKALAINFGHRVRYGRPKTPQAPGRHDGLISTPTCSRGASSPLFLLPLSRSPQRSSISQARLCTRLGQVYR